MQGGTAPAGRARRPSRPRRPNVRRESPRTTRVVAGAGGEPSHAPPIYCPSRADPTHATVADTGAFADSSGPVYLAAKTLPEVISGLQAWIMGILAAVATLFLVLAGVYYATAGGDPAQVDKAKGAFKNALIGYGLAVLAPVLLEVVKGIVGG